MTGERCLSCGGGWSHGGEPVAEARCAYLTAIKANLVEYASTLDKAPTAATVVDLWAHAREMHDDGTAAAAWTRRVLDLGWRPVVGAGGGVRDRERAVKAAALREVACETRQMPADTDKAAEWLRSRADRIERGAE